MSRLGHRAQGCLVFFVFSSQRYQLRLFFGKEVKKILLVFFDYVCIFVAIKKYGRDPALDSNFAGLFFERPSN